MMPTSLIDLERGKGLCCCFPLFIPSASQGVLGRGFASCKGRACLAVPGTGVGLECPPSGEHREGVGQAATAPVQSKQEWSSLDFCNAKITNIFLLKYK